MRRYIWALVVVGGTGLGIFLDAVLNYKEPAVYFALGVLTALFGLYLFIKNHEE